MAKANANDMLSYLMLGGGLYIAYGAALSGALGCGAYKAVVPIHNAISKQRFDVNSCPSSTTPPGGTIPPGGIIPPGGTVPPGGGCNKNFIAGKQYVDFNVDHQQYAVVLCSNVVGFFNTQGEAEAYYNANVCQNQNC